MEAKALKWCGWGFDDASFPLESRPVLRAYLVKRLRFEAGEGQPPVRLDSIRLPPSLLGPEDLASLRAALGEEGLSLAAPDRVAHAAGRGYKDLVRLRAGRIERFPDAVAFPEDDDSVRRLLEIADRRRFAVVPFGGGTSVVGGVEPLGGETFEAVLTVDLRRLRRVHAIDAHSGTATVDAGLRGPLLEEAVRAHGLSFPHFPQSWEFSTVGGWIATRASGALSNRYGGIEDLVAAVRLVTPTRTLDAMAFPRGAHGPDLRELVLGSEGTLGIVTRATLRVHPAPTSRRFATRLLHGFADGVEALRRMAHEDALPDLAYLSDEEETRFAIAASGIDPERPTGLARVALGSGGREGSALLMGFEGEPRRTAAAARLAARIVRPSRNLGAGPARRWYEERFRFPYLRDSLLDHGLLADTVETAAPWSKLLAVYDAARGALERSLWSAGGAGLVLCHVSHAYHDGASLYFTFLGRPRPGEEIALWETVKAAVTVAIVDAGGALSHHHGIGADHAPYLGRVIGEDGSVVLRALKRELDPNGIMNPGKLLAGTP